MVRAMFVIFMAFAVLGLLMLCAAIIMFALHRRTPAVIVLAGTVLFLGLAGATVAVGQYRYRQCIKEVELHCPAYGCEDSYHGPYIPDCQNRRVFG